MPRAMFAEVVSPGADSNRKWYSVPLSLLVHALLFALLVAVPLIATDVVPPEPRRLLEYAMPDVVPVAVDPPPARVARPTESQMPPVGPRVAPVEAPAAIEAETGLIPNNEPHHTGAIDSLVDRIGGNEFAVDLPPVAAAAAPIAPVRPGGDIKPPVRIKNVVPDYPSVARSVKKEGVVIIEAIIGIDGKVANARVIRSVHLLDDAALDAVRQWEYTPTRLNGQPTPVIMTVTVRFTLN